jgi:DNA-binding response OmpR family regulator
MKVLMIDTDTELPDRINYGFLEELFEVRHAFGAIAGLRMAMEHEFDLVVLDWTLPEKGGLSVLKKLRNYENRTPILMLTAEDCLSDVLQSLESGANSCLPRPFEMPVLIARMKALVRRSNWDRGVQMTPESGHPYLSGRQTP